MVPRRTRITRTNTLFPYPRLLRVARALVGALEHDIQFRFAFDPFIDLVLVEKVQIQQGVLNLVRNDVDALAESLPGTRELTISIDPDADMAREIGRASCRERVCQYV